MDYAAAIIDTYDTARLEWMLSQFHTTDNAWMASFCFSVDMNGIRAAIDKQMLKDAPK